MLWSRRAQRLPAAAQATAHGVPGHRHWQRVLLRLRGRDDVVPGGQVGLAQRPRADRVLHTRHQHSAVCCPVPGFEEGRRRYWSRVQALINMHIISVQVHSTLLKHLPLFLFILSERY